MGHTDLDKKLQEMAAQDWAAFVMLIGAENVVKAKICILKGQRKSVRLIARKLNIPRSSVGDKCQKCPAPTDGIKLT